MGEAVGAGRWEGLAALWAAASRARAHGHALDACQTGPASVAARAAALRRAPARAGKGPGFDRGAANWSRRRRGAARAGKSVAGVSASIARCQFLVRQCLVRQACQAFSAGPTATCSAAGGAVCKRRRQGWRPPPPRQRPWSQGSWASVCSASLQLRRGGGGRAGAGVVWRVVLGRPEGRLGECGHTGHIRQRVSRPGFCLGAPAAQRRGDRGRAAPPGGGIASVRVVQGDINRGRRDINRGRRVRGARAVRGTGPTGAGAPRTGRGQERLGAGRPGPRRLAPRGRRKGCAAPCAGGSYASKPPRRQRCEYCLVGKGGVEAAAPTVFQQCSQAWPGVVGSGLRPRMIFMARPLRAVRRDGCAAAAPAASRAAGQSCVQPNSGLERRPR
jgi:hypothetical protein